MSKKGYKQTKEHREKIRISMKGKKNTLGCHWKLSKEIKKKKSMAMKGNKNPAKRLEVREKMSKAKKGIPSSMKGKTLSEKIKRKMKRNKNALGHHWKLSDKTKQKMSEKALQRIQNHHGPFKDTKPELKMKEILNELSIPFKHQFRVGNHLFDFYILNTNILIEVDGDYWHGNLQVFEKLSIRQLKQKEKDLKNEQLAKEKDFVVLRFWESDILKNENKIIQYLGNYLRKLNV